MDEFIFKYYIFFYVAFSCLLIIILGVFAFFNIKKHQSKSVDFEGEILLNSSYRVGISVIAPAYNEEKTIIVNVNSLLTLNYPLYEVIIVNDGSHDNTLKLLIEEFELVKTPFAYTERINIDSYKGIFKSKNPKFKKLTVVDKENIGAKADALNAGINASSPYPYFLCTDVDCILKRDTLLKMILPVLATKRRVIGVGAPLWLSNGCEVQDGKIKNIAPPKELIPRFQVIEYLRAYLLGKIGWGYINAVPNISGALGLYEKEVVVKCGGYDIASHAEDMDMMIRVAAYMLKRKEAYKITYIPTACCLTEAPPNLIILGHQRRRWACGLAQTIWQHKHKLFNLKFKKIGILVLPFTFFFDFLAPIIEMIGLFYFIYLILIDRVDWNLVGYTFLFAYSFSIAIGSLVLVYDHYIQKQYKRNFNTIKLWFLLFLEPFIYHPFLVFYSLQGYFKFLSSRKMEWGTMTRQGYERESKFN